MFRRISAILALVGIAYLAAWPVQVDPVAWDAPVDQGYTGDYALNDRLAAATIHDLNGESGPEDAAFGADGALYFPVHSGKIMRRAGDGGLTVWAETGGRPLGLEPAPGGGFYVADAYQGLLLVTEGDSKVLTNNAGGLPLLYADDLDVAPDGAVWFTDASTKFGAEQSGGSLQGSYLEILEHGRTGRILRYDPATGETQVKLTGISFANGLAMAADGQSILYIETGEYALRRLFIAGAREGVVQTVLTNLPGFPDNINRDPRGGFLMGLVSKRAPIADALADQPFLRKVVQRLPAAVRPKARSHGFIIRLSEDGKVLETWQDETGAYPLTTGAVRAPDGSLWITSLGAPGIAHLAD